MLRLKESALADKAAWPKAGIALPSFDRAAARKRTADAPEWIHFGSGNIFRGFVAVLQQDLLDKGLASTGIVSVGLHDREVIDKVFTPYDDLTLLVTMRPDGRFEKKVVASVVKSLVAESDDPKEWGALKAIFAAPSLKMVSFTITEKGYALANMAGAVLPEVETDYAAGPAKPRSSMGKIASLAYERFRSGALPIAFVSMDNMSHNGDKLGAALKTIASEWEKRSLVEPGFAAYLADSSKVSFPWSMIDKITPRPSESVRDELAKVGFADAEIICTTKKAWIAPFVNAEGPQYLVVEDNFPNGRPALEKAGVIFTKRETVDKVEKMKVCTCLNPLHTSLAVLGCVLGYTSIAAEMKDPLLKRLVEKIGYDEGLPVVVNPGILDPKVFIKEVLEQRFPNPFIPDTPQRIATDTSQKVGIRFGETLKAYKARADLDPASLRFIPLAIAGWCRYLLAVDDTGKAFEPSPDPMLEQLRAAVASVKLGSPAGAGAALKPILSNAKLFGSDLYDLGLGKKIEGYFEEMIVGPGAVKATLQKHLA